MLPSIIASTHADDLRELLGLNTDDVVGDIVSLIAETAGYEYEEKIFDEPFYASAEYKGSGLFRITYNLKFDWNLAFKRFTLAHELGHITMHHQYLRESILHRCYTNDQFVKDKEKEADCFAANFLAPSKACLELIKSKELRPETITSISTHFNISTYASALRFIELTDLTCAFIVSNKAGQTEYERRSPKMLDTFTHKFVYKTRVHPYTLTHDFLREKQEVKCCDSQMRYWYPDIKKDAKVKECVIDLGYNDKYMTLLTPEFSDYEAYLDEEDIDTAGKYINN